MSEDFPLDLFSPAAEEEEVGGFCRRVEVKFPPSPAVKHRFPWQRSRARNKQKERRPAGRAAAEPGSGSVVPLSSSLRTEFGSVP